jgi:hypothetical protein
MSTLRELPHVDDLALLSREALISEHERISLELVDMDRELHDATLDKNAGLFVEPEWLNRLKYGRSVRRRLVALIKTRVHTLRRQELGGDPLAITHRRFLHAVLTALNRHPNRELAGEIYTAAKQIAASETHKVCDLCAMQSLDNAQRSERVAENIDLQAAKPSVVGDLGHSDQMPATLTG